MNSDAIPSVFDQSLPKQQSKDQQPYLSDLSPNDKPWDTHKAQSLSVSDALSLGFEPHKRQSDRIKTCSEHLEFGWVLDSTYTGETNLKLKTAYFCRVRHCPTCQWRRSLMWVSRFYNAFPKIYEDHPDWRYILVTFTVRNCPVTDLRKTITDMNSAWKRLTERKSFPGLGYVRSLEITRQKDNGYAHPHYHCLIAVPPGYFVGRKYLSTAKWAAMWQEALRIDYTPICDARIVKPKDYSEMRGKTIWETSGRENFELGLDEVRNGILDDASDMGMGRYEDDKRQMKVTNYEHIFSAIREVIKYAVKPDDMLADPFWLIELSTQLKNSRAVALGGEFRKYLKEDDGDNQELIGESESLSENDGGIHFGWRDKVKRYQKNV